MAAKMWPAGSYRAGMQNPANPADIQPDGAHMPWPGGSNPTIDLLNNGNTCILSASASDAIGTLLWNTGVAPAAGNQVHVLFGVPYPTSPRAVVFVPMSAAGVSAGLYLTTFNINGFWLTTANVPAASTFYSVQYVVIE